MTQYRHDYSTKRDKLFRKLHSAFFKLIKDREKANIFYASYRHRNKQPGKTYMIQYMTQQPNFGAGFGHGLDVWRAGVINAKALGLEYAYTPMVTDEWDRALGLGEKEESCEKLINQGYRVVKLPYYDMRDKMSRELIEKIIRSYRVEKVIFLNEFEQDSAPKDMDAGNAFMRKKFFEAAARKEDKLIYDKKKLNVAVHIRRGDVSEGMKAGDESMRKRWLDESYYVKVIESIEEQLKDKEKEAVFYIFSEGDVDDFPELKKLERVKFCLDMPAVESFVHMCRADLLVTGLSSFSYDPGLINPVKKIAPKKFWNPYPKNGEWIFADENGNIAEEELKCLF